MIHCWSISLKAEFYKVEDSLCRMSYQIYRAEDHEELPLDKLLCVMSKIAMDVKLVMPVGMVHES